MFDRWVNRVRSLAKGERRRAAIVQSLWSNGAQVVEAVRGFVIVPLALHDSGMVAYGWWVTIFGLIQVVSMLDLGLTGPLQRELASASAQQDRLRFALTLKIGLMIVCTMALVILVVGTGVVIGSMHSLHLSAVSFPGLLPALMMAVMATSLGIVNTLLRASGVAQLHPAAALAPHTLSRAFGLVLTILAFHFGLGLRAISLGMLVAELLILSIFLHQHRRWLRLPVRPTWDEFKPWFRISRVTFFSRIVGSASERLETSIIGWFISPEAATLYSVGKKLASLVDLVLHSFWASVMSPLTYYAVQSDPSIYRQKFDWAYGALTRVGLLSYACYVVTNPWVISVWVGPGMVSAGNLYGVIALAMLSTFLFDLLNETALLMGRPMQTASQTMGVAVTRLVLMYLLGVKFGILGLVFAVLLANTLWMGVVGWLLRRRYGLLRSGVSLGALSFSFLLLGGLCSLFLSRLQGGTVVGFPSTLAWGGGVMGLMFLVEALRLRWWCKGRMTIV